MTIETSGSSAVDKVLDIVQDLAVDMAVVKAALPDIVDHEKRLRIVERNQWILVAGLLAIQGVLNLLPL